MGGLDHLWAALSPLNLLLALAGVAAGTVIGALPGLTATMAVAVLVPFTFSMEPAAALIALGAIYTGAIYGGAYAAILLNTPGTPSAIATTFDGYPHGALRARRPGASRWPACVGRRRAGRRGLPAAAGAADGHRGAALRPGRVLLARGLRPHADRIARRGLDGQGPDRRLLRPAAVDGRRGRGRRRHPLRRRVQVAARRHRRRLGTDRPVLHPGADRARRHARETPRVGQPRGRLPAARSRQTDGARQAQSARSSVVGTVVGICRAPAGRSRRWWPIPRPSACRRGGRSSARASPRA
jgi:hypothetical protein